MGKHGRRYQQARAEIDAERVYYPLTAVRMVKEQELTRSTPRSRCTCGWASTSATPTSSFAARSACRTAPGREVTVAVFAEGDKAREAEAAGADFVGGDDLAKRIQDGFTDFDVAIATPDMMGTVGKLGRILGPRARCRTPRAARSRSTSARPSPT